MDWTQILLSALTFLGGGGIATLVTLRSKHKKGEAEADVASIGALECALKLASDKDAVIAAKDAKIEELRTELAAKRDENTTKGYYMCVHLGCPLRRPSLGRGKTYFTQNSGSENFGADYTSIETLYNDYKRKAPEWFNRAQPTPEQTTTEQPTEV